MTEIRCTLYIAILSLLRARRTEEVRSLRVNKAAHSSSNEFQTTHSHKQLQSIYVSLSGFVCMSKIGGGGGLGTEV